jgi:hypothetical protein
MHKKLFISIIFIFSIIFCGWAQISLFPFNVPEALAAETGWQSGNCVSVGRDFGDPLWSNPQFAQSSDDFRAISDVDSNGNSDWLRCTNFGFTTADIPSGATIDGIEVQIERQSENGDIDDSAIYLRDSVGQTGDNKASPTNWGTFDSTATYGGASDDWNALLSDSDIRDTSFGIDISANNDNGFAYRQARVDHVLIKVYYTVASSPQYTQDSFRVRNDNGGETDSTWTEAANTDWTQMVDKNFRARFLVQETAGIADSSKTFQLEYNLNGGGWNDVTGSSAVIKATVTANVTDGVDTTQQLGSGLFATPNGGFDEADGQVGSMNFAGSDEVELEFSLQIVGSDVSNGDTIQLRVKGLDTYANTPTVTVTGAGTFLYKKSIHIQEGEVTCTSNVTNFPVMVELTGGDFLEVSDDVDADGFDIIFKAEDDATCGGAGLAPCILDHEIEEYDETTDNRLVAWVRIPVLDFNDNTTIYLYYGNTNVTVATENPTGVWDSSYRGVWHLHDDLLDSTSNNNDGTDSGGSTNGTGQMADGQTFDGIDDYIYTANLFNDPQEFTISAWFSTNSASGRKIVGFENDQTGTGSINWDRHLYVGTDGYAYFGAYDGDPVDVAVSTNTLNDNSWHHVVGVRDDTTDNLHLYVDGNLDDTTPNTFAEAGIGYWRIGSYKTTGWTNGVDGYFPGTIDEVRISLTARSLCWIQTEHSNQETPTSFYVVDPEVPSGLSGAVSGTITSSTTKTDIVSGGKTIVITLTGDTWVPIGAAFDAQRQNIIDGLNSAQSETNGWNNEVRDKQSVSGVVRTSNTEVTITLDAQAAYDISANETITATVPASALVASSSPLVQPHPDPLPLAQ